MNRGAGAIVLGFGGVVLLIMAVRGSLGNVWKALLTSDTAGASSAPGQAAAAAAAAVSHAGQPIAGATDPNEVFPLPPDVVIPGTPGSGITTSG